MNGPFDHDRTPLGHESLGQICSAGATPMLSSLGHLLGIVLYVGNYLNGGTPRGRADGFALDTLVLMRTVKMRLWRQRAGTSETCLCFLRLGGQICTNSLTDGRRICSGGSAAIRAPLELCRFQIKY